MLANLDHPTTTCFLLIVKGCYRVILYQLDFLQVSRDTIAMLKCTERYSCISPTRCATKVFHRNDSALSHASYMEASANNFYFGYSDLIVVKFFFFAIHTNYNAAQSFKRANVIIYNSIFETRDIFWRSKFAYTFLSS